MQPGKEMTMTPPERAQNSLAIWLMIALLALIWAGSFLFGRIIMLEWPPISVAFLRVLIAAAALWLFVLATGRKIKITKTFAISLLGMGMLNNVIPFSLILYGQTEIGSGLASVVNAMTPIWTLIIANQLTADEKITTNRSVGIIFGFLGVALLIGSDFLNGLTASAWAQAAVLLATLSYGFAGVFGKRFKSEDPVIVATGQLTASTIIMLPMAFMLESPLSLPAPSTELVVSLFGLAIICTSLAYILFFHILAKAGATYVSLVTFLIPVGAIGMGYLFLSETLSLNNFLGTSLILLGLLAIDGRFFQYIRNKLA